MNGLILALAVIGQSPEVLSAPKEIYINQQGSYCWAQQVLQGNSNAVGKWRVLYKTSRALTASVPYSPLADPYGFTNWLNGIRASYGLGSVYYDANLAENAALNSAQMAAKKSLLHEVRAGRWQNSAMGNYASIGSMWMNSTPHRQALLQPGITRIGLAGYGVWWTLNLD